MSTKIQELMQQYEVVKFGKFELQSGRTSNVYIDLRKLTMDSVALFIVCDEMIKKILEVCPDVQGIGGMMTGANPIVDGVLTLLGARGRTMKGFLVRKETKDYGLGRKIEGQDAFFPGMRVVIVEDVTTTGDSAFKAVLAAKSMGCKVEAVITVADREEGAAQKFKESGVPFFSLFNHRNLLNRG
jgi:orotate phosphoribosyltransferase